MPTPKDAQYKLRQSEFRKLNKESYYIPKGVKPSEYVPKLKDIKHKEIEK